MEVQYSLPSSLKRVEDVVRTEQSVVLRCWIEREKRHVLVKLPVGRKDSESLMLRYKEELRRLRRLRDVVFVHSLLEHDGRPLLLMEDFQGRPLCHWMEEQTFSALEVMQIVRVTSEMLELIHKQGVIHQQITPATVLWSSEERRVQIIDFGWSTEFQQWGQGSPQTVAVEGSLLYVSPEQTGRLERGVDHRTDLYSLGAMAWHLLVGSPPFPFSSRKELLYHHLAIRPTPPHKVRSDVPLLFSEILLKLMAKNPDDRYQSAWGLTVDLRRCLEAFEKGERTFFALGQTDRMLRFGQTGRLYGREREQMLLRRKLMQAQGGERACVWVYGPPGVGKTSLVQTLAVATSRSQGHFVSGRFEPMHGEMPYHAIRAALRTLLQKILAEGEARLLFWKTRIKQALGEDNIGVLSDFLPELQLLLGAGTTPGLLSAQEERYRIHKVFLDLLQALASPQHPLVFFLDDLQWADAASLELIEFITTDQAISGFVFVGSFRDEEKTSSFQTWLASLRERESNITELPLVSLTSLEIQQMLVELCDCVEEDIRPLAQLLVEKTAGNPFFVQVLLQQLHQEQLLWLEGERWCWDEKAIRALPATDNVISLLVGSMQQQPESLRKALKLAACLGVEFRLQTFASLMHSDIEEAYKQLQSLIEEGLLQCNLQEPLGESEFRFAHDRVQEAAYSLMPEQERMEVHLQVARVLQLESQEPTIQQLYDRIHHFQQGASLIEDSSELKACAQLALEVGQHAHKSRAFESARQLLLWGLSVLGESRWQTNYELTLQLSCAAVEAGLACRDREWMDSCIQEVLEHGRSLVEQLPVWKASIQSMISADRMNEALSLANEFFRRAGAPLIRPRPRVAILPKAFRLLWKLRGRGPAILEQLSVAKDPLNRAIIEIRVQAMSAVFPMLPKQVPFLTIVSCLDSLQHGLADRNINAWAGFGLFVANALGNVERGLEYVDCASKQLRRIGHLEFAPRMDLVSLLGVKAWLFPFEALFEATGDIFKKGMNVGDLYTALLAKGLEFVTGYQAGVSLARLETLTLQSIQTCEHYQHFFTLRQKQLSLQSIQLLRREQPPSLSEQSLGHPDDFKDATGEGGFQLFQIHLYVVFGSWREALELAMTQHLSPHSPGSLIFRNSYWTYSLVALYHGIEQGWTTSWKSRRLRKARWKQLQAWVKHHPESRQYRLCWVEAARLRSLKRGFLALEQYDKAIEMARQSGACHDAGLIAEQAASLCHVMGHLRMEQHFRTEALSFFEQWGAHAKVSALKQEAAALVGKPSSLLLSKPSSELKDTPQVHLLSIEDARKHVDLQAVLQASKALSTVSERKVLLEQFMRLMLEHSYAQRGLLLLRKYGEWEVAVHAHSSDGDMEFSNLKVSLQEEESLFSAAMLRYVMLSHDSVVLSDASSEGPFVHDPYVLEMKPRSVMCFPVLLQNEIIGLVVLENSLMVGVFTEERQKLLEVIATHAAMNLRILQHSSSSEIVPPSFSDYGSSYRQTTLNEPLLRLPQGATNASSHEKSLEGKTVGDWTILRPIAEGGMSRIFQAHNKYMDQQAAIKMLLPEYQHQPTQVQRFEREALILERLKHPHIVDLLDFDQDPLHGPFMALEYLEGETLHDVLERHAPVPLVWLLNVLEQVCDALATIHRQKILHRDLKPSNIFLTPNEPFPHVHLLDFGIAENYASATDLRLTSTGVIVGTPSYLAPEQLKDTGTLQPATDLYALGVILFEALTGKHPLGTGSSVELFVKVLQDEPTPLGALRPEFKASSLETGIEELLTKDPDERPNDAEHLFNELSVECLYLDDPLDAPEHYPVIQTKVQKRLT